MNLVLTVMEITAPVFVLAAIGYGWVRLNLDYPVEFVTRIAMTISTPALVFSALVHAEIAPGALGRLSVASFAAYGLVGLAAYGVLRVLKRDRRTYLAPLIFGNTGNLGLPLALFAFGEAGLSYAVVVFAVMIISSFTVGIWMVSGHGSISRVLREPLVWGTVLGALFLTQGWPVPKVVDNTLGLIGQIAIPMMLITLGVAVARLHTRDIWLAIGLSGLKLVLSASFAAFVAWAFGLDTVATGVLIVQIATPVAVTSYLLAQKYGADAQAVAGLVVVSTLMAVIALPLLLVFLI